jgi:hypothetical protein
MCNFFFFFFFVPGFVQPQNPPSGFDAPIPSTSNTYVPPTTPSHTPSYPSALGPYNPLATATTPNDGGLNSLPSFGSYNPASGGNGSSNSEGTV